MAGIYGHRTIIYFFTQPHDMKYHLMVTILQFFHFLDSLTLLAIQKALHQLTLKRDNHLLLTSKN